MNYFSISEMENTPQPIAPLPTPQQYKWHRYELQMFLHFGINTFSGEEWGCGTEDINIFNPLDMDCKQWAEVAKENGFKRMILTAKHHDGFCLWPTKHSDYSVKNCKWRDGQGDVVGEFAAACKQYNIGVGIYLSPWDRHDARYGTYAYNDYYINQINELFDNYGMIETFWLDLAFGEEKDYRNPFDWQRIYAAIYKRNPGCIIEMGGPDVGWVGNENGIGLETCWNFNEVPNRTFSGVLTGNLPISYVGGIQEEPDNIGKHPNYKAIPALRYVPKMIDASVRKGWFWKANESRGIDWWLNTYFNSVGRGSSMTYGFAPDRRGLFPEEDVECAKELTAMLGELYSTDFAKDAKITADSTWQESEGFEAERMLDGDPYTYWAGDCNTVSAMLELEFPKEITFNVVCIEEPIFMGQRIKNYKVLYWNGEDWRLFSEGTTVGYRKLDYRDTVTCRRLRIEITDARSYVLVSKISVYFTSAKIVQKSQIKTNTREENAI